MKLIWLPKALETFEAQIDYIAKDSVKAAIEQGNLIENQIHQLLDHPEIGRTGRTKGTRELVVNGIPFIVVYRVKPRLERIELIRVLHGAQQWPPRNDEEGAA